MNNQLTFDRLIGFLIDSPKRYDWFGRRFVIMPDHIHVIARMGYNAISLGQWVKAMKAVVGGLEPRNAEAKNERPVRAPGLQSNERPVRAPGLQERESDDERPVRAPGLQERATDDERPVRAPGLQHAFNRTTRSWRWQQGFHDHKLRTPESESRKWEYVCLNPVRYGLVNRPEDWPFGGEVFYDEAVPRLVAGTPPLLESGVLIQKEGNAARQSDCDAG